ncbi:hypothetical protein [Brevundimonas sp. EYE_349]|uniref:hypothetical protein n=1 Tax=Brevundimonas sp. EYE_349 TaxID=2853455 RepID=UPI0020048197|nr:hypothetical protein [Brevundimonas sp. EYE_349]MCK6105996.1 hypothetical protein [Brevundimonas sp. EYE_349]
MAASDFYLTLFAVPATGPRDGGLEDRVKAFLESSPMTESLDDAKFADVIGSASKADYLLANRAFIFELKTLNGDPKDRVENRLRERFAQPGGPIVFGQVGLSQIVDGLDDSQAVYKAVLDLSSRAVRRHLQKTNEQVASTREGLSLDDAAGMLVLMNDGEPMIDAACIGYSIKAAIEAVESGYPEIRYVLAIIESHRIRLPGGGEGYPLLLVCRQTDIPIQDAQFLGLMLDSWAKAHGAGLVRISHHGDWSAMDPIYDGGPPVLSPYR